MSSYAYGEPVTLTLTKADGTTAALADYAEVVLTIVQPDGTSVVLKKSDATLTDNPHTFQPAQTGRHSYYYITTTPNGATTPQPFTVKTQGQVAAISPADLGEYLNETDLDATRAQFIIDQAQALCESIVTPLPDGAEAVVLDVAERAFANPTAVGGSELGLYSEGVGPFSTSTPGTAGGGLWLTENNIRTLRRLAGKGGAFTVDTLAATYTPTLPIWDSANVFGGDWDSPPT
jgi:hypothetical protein